MTMTETSLGLAYEVPVSLSSRNYLRRIFFNYGSGLARLITKW